MKYLCLLFCGLLVFTAHAQHTYFYVGSATEDTPTPITLCQLDNQTGAVKQLQAFSGTASSSYLCVSPDGKYLFAVDSKGPVEDEHSVAAFAIDPASKHLSFINRQSVKGRGACHLSTTHDGRYLMVANYSTGNIAVMPIGKNGELGDLTDHIQHTGSGPDKSRQEAAHAHYIQSSKNDKYVFAVDLGIDKVMNYQLDKTSGKLSPNPNQAVFNTAPGVGPRHMVFHPTQKYAYILNELNSTVTACTYNKAKGTLKAMATHPMLPEGFTDFSKAAAIRVHPSGKYLYASNRGHDSIAVYEIDKKGNLKRVQLFQEGIEWPRDFAIESTGKYMIEGNRNKNEIRVYDVEKGKISATSYRLDIAQPTSIVFLP